MSSPILVPALLGKPIGSFDDGFVIAEWQDAGAPTGQRHLIAPLHVHHHDDEAWYVVEGSLGVKVGESELEAQVGGAIFVPRGTPHTYWNARAGRLRYLLVMTSTIHKLIQEIHTATNRSPEAMREIFRRHDSELLA